MREDRATLTTVSHMPDTQRSEHFSIAYVRAIAARAGMSIWRPDSDFGTDLAFTKIDTYQTSSVRRGRRNLDVHNINLAFQVKSTKNWAVVDNTIRYDLEAQAYDDLIYRKNTSLLLVMCLPPTIQEWLCQDEQKLQMYHCCYYWEPAEEDIMTPNDQTKRLFIPRTQIFTPDALTEMFNQRQRGMHL